VCSLSLHSEVTWLQWDTNIDIAPIHTVMYIGVGTLCKSLCVMDGPCCQRNTIYIVETFNIFLTNLKDQKLISSAAIKTVIHSYVKICSKNH
jgi:hypothetical protein